MDLTPLILADYARIQSIFPDNLPVSFSDLDPELQLSFSNSYNQLISRLTDLGFGRVNSLGYGQIIPALPITPLDPATTPTNTNTTGPANQGG